MKRTYAGASKSLERAVVVAFYRTLESLGIPRDMARAGVARADRGLQAIGAVYLALVGVLVAVWLIVEALGG